MKRCLLLILALCGSVAAQEFDAQRQHFVDERRSLDARIRETEEQIKYHGRRALYCEGVLIELRFGGGGSDLADIKRRLADFADTKEQIRYHEAKEGFFGRLLVQLRSARLGINNAWVEEGLGWPSELDKEAAR